MSSPNEPFDEVWLTAYLDNELEADEHQRVENALESSPSLRQLLAELSRVRDLVGQCRLNLPTSTREFSNGPWNESSLQSNQDRIPTKVSAFPPSTIVDTRWRITSTRLANLAASIVLFLSFATIAWWSSVPFRKIAKTHDTNSQWPPSAASGTVEEANMEPLGNIVLADSIPRVGASLGREPVSEAQQFVEFLNGLQPDQSNADSKKALLAVEAPLQQNSFRFVPVDILPANETAPISDKPRLQSKPAGRDMVLGTAGGAGNETEPDRQIQSTFVFLPAGIPSTPQATSNGALDPGTKSPGKQNSYYLQNQQSDSELALRESTVELSSKANEPLNRKEKAGTKQQPSYSFDRNEWQLSSQGNQTIQLMIPESEWPQAIETLKILGFPFEESAIDAVPLFVASLSDPNTNRWSIESQESEFMVNRFSMVPSGGAASARPTSLPKEESQSLGKDRASKAEDAPSNAKHLPGLSTEGGLLEDSPAKKDTAVNEIAFRRVIVILKKRDGK